MKKTKSLKTQIVCTVGPACRDEKTLRQLMINGMTIARLNFAHGDLKQHGEDIARIRKVASGLGRTCPILIDLPGPKIRLGKLKKEPIQLKEGALVKLTTFRPKTSRALRKYYRSIMPISPRASKKAGWFI